MARTGDGMKGEDARLAVARVACDLVADGGLDNVSMRRIANQLGVTTGYITHYYLGKEDLLEAALLAALDELTPPQSGWSADLDEWIDAAVGILPDHGGSERFWRVLTAFQSASLNSDRLAGVLNTYAQNSLTNLVSHLADRLEVDSTTAERTALARSIFAFSASVGVLVTTTPGAVAPAQSRALLRAGVHGLVDEFARQHTDGPGPRPGD